MAMRKQELPAGTPTVSAATIISQQSGAPMQQPLSVHDGSILSASSSISNNDRCLRPRVYLHVCTSFAPLGHDRTFGTTIARSHTTGSHSLERARIDAYAAVLACLVAANGSVCLPCATARWHARSQLCYSSHRGDAPLSNPWSRSRRLAAAAAATAAAPATTTHASCKSVSSPDRRADRHRSTAIWHPSAWRTSCTSAFFAGTRRLACAVHTSALCRRPDGFRGRPP